MLNAVWFVLAGMAIVFLTLGLLILAMIGLNRWFGPEPATKGPTTRAGHA